MADTSATGRNWRSLYEAALAESDRSRLPARITAARAAILDLEQVVEPSPNERQAREDALRGLERLAEVIVAGEVA